MPTPRAMLSLRLYPLLVVVAEGVGARLVAVAVITGASVAMPVVIVVELPFARTDVNVEVLV